jgi:hypothetical protein
LIVFASAAAPVPLVALRDVLVNEGYPANFGIEIAGAASEEDLNTVEWDATFLRWLTPEIHEVALLDCSICGQDEEAEQLIGQHLARIADLKDAGGKLIVAEQLNKSRTVYTVELLPALLADENHDAWGCLDVLLRFIAASADGLIYAEAEGYCDSDGELMLAETDELFPVDMAELE